MGECQVSSDVIDLVFLWENLRAELTADVTVCGELSDQNALIVATLTIHSHWRHDVPSAANAIVDGEALAFLEGIGPRTWDQFHASFSTLRLLHQSHSHVAVVSKLGDQGNGAFTQVIGSGSA